MNSGQIWGLLNIQAELKSKRGVKSPRNSNVELFIGPPGTGHDGQVFGGAR